MHNLKAFGLLRRGLAPYKKRDNTACLRVNSHNPYYLFICMACSFRECSQRESNPQLALRRRLLYPFNYENKCRIFGLFSHFGSCNHI